MLTGQERNNYKQKDNNEITKRKKKNKEERENEIKNEREIGLIEK